MSKVNDAHKALRALWNKWTGQDDTDRLTSIVEANRASHEPEAMAGPITMRRFELPLDELLREEHEQQRTFADASQDAAADALISHIGKQRDPPGQPISWPGVELFDSPLRTNDDRTDSLAYALDVSRRAKAEMRSDLKTTMADSDKMLRRMAWRSGQAIDLLRSHKHAKLVSLYQDPNSQKVRVFSRLTGERIGSLDGHAYITMGEEALMGMMDELARLAAGESLKNLMGMFTIGERIALEPGIWKTLADRDIPGMLSPNRRPDGTPWKEYRTGTIIDINRSDDGESVIATVKHDSDDLAIWDVLGLRDMASYLERARQGKEGSFRCLTCCDTGYPEGDPGNGDCDCRSVTVNFTETDADFAERRRARMRKKNER